jgi:putative SOS response-associated peptidase YedK
MCGRFTQHYTWAEVHAFLSVFGELGTPRNLQPRYNITPTDFIDVVTARTKDREIVDREMVPMRWGLTHLIHADERDVHDAIPQRDGQYPAFCWLGRGSGPIWQA